MQIDADQFLPFDPSSLKDATVILHGATGAVGSAVLERLREAGARIAVPVRRDWQVAKMQARLEGATALVAHVGSRDGEAAAGFAKGVMDSLGPVDAFVSTAGAFAVGPFARERAGSALELAEANWLSTHDLLRPLVGSMRRRRRGRLIFTGADAVGTFDGAGMALYLGCKAALHEYARCLAIELGPDGIAVAVVAPGVVDTPANRAAMPDTDRGGWTTVARLADALLGAASRAEPRAADPIHALAPDGGGANG